GMHYADNGTSAMSVFTVALKDIDWAPAKITAGRGVALREIIEKVAGLTLPGGRPASISDTPITTPPLAGERPGSAPDVYLSPAKWGGGVGAGGLYAERFPQNDPQG
ncbi:hypothetical protein, partial [Streptomyces viridochromogenes]|uniref:hypothetical protein n=1 Tax=Streptomyces viridochromogenes TaxID=1938 RepID=UPI000A91AA7A